MGERSNSLYARLRYRHENRQRTQVLFGGTTHSTLGVRVSTPRHLIPYATHDRIHHIPLEETYMSMSMKQVWKHTEYQRKMLTNAIMRYLEETPAKDWTEAQKALWNEMTDVNNHTIEEHFGI